MPSVTPFKGIRPDPALADRIAALPYDVYNRNEALEEVRREPLSFLAIDRAETMLAADIDTYDDRVYQTARELMDSQIQDGHFIKDETPCF